MFMVGGNDDTLVLCSLKSYGLRVRKIIDKDTRKQGKCLDDVEIIGIESFIETKGEKFVFIG